VAQTLGMLEGFSLAGGPDADAVHLILEAEKLAYADRNKYIADTDQVPLPHGYLDPAYLRGRVGLIDPKRASGRAEPGQPPMKRASVYGVDATVEGSGTTQISVVDKDGNAVSMTTSIETAFGSRMMAAGFFLNNQLTDFSFAPRDGSGVQIANRPGPGKRPRSSMAPTMIFDADGRLWAVLGTPGGSRIIFYVVKAIAALVDWNMTPADAAALGTFGSRNGPAEVEARADLDDLAAALEARGHEVARPSMTSGLHIVQVRPEGLLGGADPRREGAVFGD
jgi:gamma-glutamyltranspeptidase/glutathione hydrolase